MSDKLMFWLDIETTGLDPKEDFILEVGVVIYDLDFEIVDSGCWAVKQHNPHWPSRMPDFVNEMHTKSGLLDRLSRPEECATLPYIGHAIQGLKKDYNLGLDGTDPICGSSVQFDRNFLEQHLPAVLTGFSYRNIDVSTLKETYKKFCPVVLDDLPDAKKAHRPLWDIDDSMREYKHYLLDMGLVV